MEGLRVSRHNNTSIRPGQTTATTLRHYEPLTSFHWVAGDWTTEVGGQKCQAPGLDLLNNALISATLHIPISILYLAIFETNIK